MGAERHPSGPPRLPRSCPDDEVLALLVDGSLEPDEDAEVRAHLDACDACRILFADVARALDSGIGRRGPLARGSELSFQKGDVIAQKYRIDRLLGKGGMGEVFAARHVELNKLVALKVMRPDMTKDPDAVRRFAREAKAAAALRSEHAVRILDVGRLDEKIPYIVMEHLDGHDLGSLAPGETLPIIDAVRYVRQACDALADAHAVGIIHRDLKPHNLFLTKDAGGAPFIKVLDFGLAKARADWKGPQDSTNTATNVMLGSPFFMSPEQVESPKHVDHRTDIWSLGATLYQLLCGVPPFLAPNVHIICARILTEDFPPARTKRPDVPKALEDILRRCMNRDLKARYQSVSDLALSLDALIEQLEDSSRSLDEAPTVARSGADLDDAATRPISAVELVADSDDPTVGEIWRPKPAPLANDDATITKEIVPKTLTIPTPVELVPQEAKAPSTIPAPPPDATVKDTIPEQRPPPLMIATPQRISTLPMKGAPRPPQPARTRMLLAVVGFVAVGAAIIAISLRRGETSPEPPAMTTTTAEPPATATVAPLAEPKPSSSIASIASIASSGSSASSARPPPAKPAGPIAPTKKPPARPHPAGTTDHDPYAAP
jgi:eukaryotic-like serine/threonine-protein kinase